MRLEQFLLPSLELDGGRELIMEQEEPLASHSKTGTDKKDTAPERTNTMAAGG